MTPSRFRWGMLLIQVGILILLQNNNLIGDSSWEGLIVLFPVVLIAVGIEKIFTKSKLQLISYLTTILLFFGGFAIAFNASGFDLQDENYFTESIYQEDANPDVRLVKATLNLDYNDLKIRDSGEELVFAEFDEFTRKPKIKSIVEDDVAIVNFEARQKSTFLGGHIIVHDEDVSEWNVQFSEDLPLELECIGFDNDLHLNFLTSRLQKLILDTKNTTIRLHIGANEPYVQVIIRGDDSKLRLRVPEKIGMKLIGNDTSFFDQIGFIKTDDGSYINANYNEAEKKIDVELDDRLISFSLDYF